MPPFQAILGFVDSLFPHTDGDNSLSLSKEKLSELRKKLQKSAGLLSRQQRFVTSMRLLEIARGNQLESKSHVAFKHFVENDALPLLSDEEEKQYSKLSVPKPAKDTHQVATSKSKKSRQKANLPSADA